MERRLLLGGTAFLLLGVTIAAAVSAPWQDDESSAERGRPASIETAPAITGLRATLVNTEADLDGPRVSWQTRWRLCWKKVPEASAYLISTISYEGVDPRPLVVRRPCYELTVASGLARRRGRYPTRSVQLTLMESSLAVSVSARVRGGSVGPPSRQVPVAAEYP